MGWDVTTLASLVTEAQFQSALLEMGERLKWMCYHVYDSRRSVPGFPDIVAVHPDYGVVFLELKTVKGRVKPEQQRWIDTLTAAGQRAYIVRPTDMDFLESMFRGEQEDMTA